MVPFHDHYEAERLEARLRDRAETARRVRERSDVSRSGSRRRWARWGLGDALRTAFAAIRASSASQVPVRQLVVGGRESGDDESEQRCA